MFVNDMIKYNITSRFILSFLKDTNRDNLTCFTQIYKALSIYQYSLKDSYSIMLQLMILIQVEIFLFKMMMIMN